MPKKKIAISLDEEVITALDKVRGDAKRSTRINTILEGELLGKKAKAQGKKGNHRKRKP